MIFKARSGECRLSSFDQRDSKRVHDSDYDYYERLDGEQDLYTNYKLIVLSRYKTSSFILKIGYVDMPEAIKISKCVDAVTHSVSC